jgi:hypothetical protein
MSVILLFSNAATPSLTVDTVPVTQRVQRATGTSIDLQITQDGTPTDTDDQTATVTITRDDGTPIVTDATATREATGHYTYFLTSAQTAQLDWLTATWTATIQTQPQTVTTRIEIVGGFLFGIGDARNDRDLKDAVKYPTTRIMDARTYAEQELERACGVTFVPRYKRLNVNGTGDRLLGLTDAPLRLLRSVTVDGTAWTDLTGVQIGYGYLSAQDTWTSGYGNIQLAYEVGYDYPPAAVTQAALILAKDYLVRGPLDDRAIQRATEDGPVFIATPGWNGNRFGIPQVDAVVDSYRVPSIA